jgi:uncharacterized protein (TIGR00255 family)
MTGYASAQHSPNKEGSEADSKHSQSSRLGMEIRTVNSRYLDLTFRLPEELRACEPALREKIGARLKRGKVELRAAVDSNNLTAVTEPSTRLLQRLNSVQDNIKAWLPAAQPLSVAEVLRLAVAESGPGRDWQVETLQLTDQLLDALMSAREREGARLAEMLIDRIAQLRALAAKAEPLIPQLVTQQRQRFLDRWAQAMQLTDGQATSEMAQDRALTEATAFAIRIDVAEELTRLASHLDELQRLITKGGEIGKRLDFLIQELHREANTLGSKSAALELTHISVDMKVLIEQMREQVQNIE